MTIRMGYWDCPSCNAKKNLGPNATCAGCGLPRGPNIAFYTDDSAPVVEDPELVARARAGADWKCKYCQKDNPAGVLDCQQCGAGPDGSGTRYAPPSLPTAHATPPSNASETAGEGTGKTGPGVPSTSKALRPPAAGSHSRPVRSTATCVGPPGW